ncbi:hypothetical protein M9H77_17810 [Catharanthus roseus]|uniref:Uncharacterized protein n=1 Tax=Catharanthus roseus TaxID=4058 RepID=A0ACC0B5V9_CATRO|nr:hypothetical protein M9H77_17810 [Catharanthus roseus]
MSFEENLFLLVPSMTNCLSSHLSFEDPLISSSVMFDPSCYGLGNLDDTSLVELNIVGFALGFDRNCLQHVCTITSMIGRRHTMEFEGQGKSVGRKLILCYGDLTMSFSSNLFVFYLMFSFKELKLFLELNAFYVILVGDCMANLFTCRLVLDIDHILKCSSSCAFLEKQLMISIARIKPSCHDLELLHDSLIFDRLFANDLTFCASMWSKICIFLRTFLENGYDESVRCFFWTLCGVFHAKFKGEFLENYDNESSFLYTSKKIFDGFIPSIKLLCL